MTDTSSTPDAGTPPPAADTPDTSQPPSSSSLVDDLDTDALGDTARRAVANLRREHRAAVDRLTADRDAALAKLQEHEDAQGTEVEQLRSKLGRVEKENAYLKQQLTERDISIAARDAASKFGIPEFADRLHGTNAEELEADAKQLADRVNPGRSADLGAGPRGDGTAPTTGMDQLIRQKARRG